MKIRHRGLLVGGALLVAACSSGGETEPLPLETAAPVTASPATDAPVPSTEPTESTEPVAETTATAEPESSTTEAPDPDGPVQVFREAAAAFNEVQLNPEDESIRDTAYSLMTERFRADRAFEVNTGEPQFLDPWKDLVVLGRAEIDETGRVAAFWYCQTGAELDEETGDDIALVYRATMESVEDQWFWANREVLAASPEPNGCPSEFDDSAFVDEETETEIVMAVAALEAADTVAFAAPQDPDAVNAYVSLFVEGEASSDVEVLNSFASTNERLLSDPGAFNESVVLSTPIETETGNVSVIVCTPENTTVVPVDEELDGQEFDRRTFILSLDFQRDGERWLVADRSRVARSPGANACEPS